MLISSAFLAFGYKPNRQPSKSQLAREYLEQLKAELQKTPGAFEAFRLSPTAVVKEHPELSKTALISHGQALGFHFLSRSEAAREACQRPETKDKRSHSQRNSWEDQKTVANRVQGMHAFWQDSENARQQNIRKARAQKTKSHWDGLKADLQGIIDSLQSPEEWSDFWEYVHQQGKQTETLARKLLKIPPSPLPEEEVIRRKQEGNRRRSIRMRQLWQNPIASKPLRDGRQALLSDPERSRIYFRNISKGLRQAWRDPAKRARLLTAALQSHEKAQRMPPIKLQGMVNRHTGETIDIADTAPNPFEVLEDKSTKKRMLAGMQALQAEMPEAFLAVCQHFGFTENATVPGPAPRNLKANFVEAGLRFLREYMTGPGSEI